MKLKLIILTVVIAFVIWIGCIEPIPPQTYAVYSMDFGGSEISGDFILGTGSIDTDTYYYYYLQDMEGRYRLKKVLVENSGIIMDKNITKDNAYVIIFDCFCSNPECASVCESSRGDGAEFHVPLGTITKEFNGNVRGRSSSSDSDDDYATTYIATQYVNPSSPASPMYYH
jgi:hypothetical protein